MPPKTLQRPQTFPADESSELKFLPSTSPTAEDDRLFQQIKLFGDALEELEASIHVTIVNLSSVRSTEEGILSFFSAKQTSRVLDIFR